MSSVDLELRLREIAKKVCPLCNRNWQPQPASKDGQWVHQSDHFNPEEPPEPCIAESIWELITDIGQ